MARPQAADYDERRDAILARAAALFAETGFHGASIADLARACGMSKSLLYHYFGSKEDILFEIMAGHVGALAEVAGAVAGETDPKARLAALTRGFMALYRDAAPFHKVLVNDLDKLPEERRREIVATERSLVEEVEHIVAELSPIGAHERRAVAMLYFGMINWTHTWYRPGGPLGATDVADLVVRIFLGGLPR